MSLASKWQNWGSHQLCLGPTWFLFLPWAPQTTGTGYPLGLWFNWCTTQGWGRRQLSCWVHYAWLQASSSAIFFSSMLWPLPRISYSPIQQNSTLFILKASFPLNLSRSLALSDRTNSTLCIGAIQHCSCGTLFTPVIGTDHSVLYFIGCWRF